MKKKNLIILLLIPFIISLLGIVTINVSFNLIDKDILAIKWDYADMEAFKVNNKYKLEAYGVSDSKYPVSTGNQLIWSLKNKDSMDEELHAEVIKENNDFYLKTLSVGEIIITCSNEKGNVFRSMNAIIFNDGAIIVNPKIKNSQNNIDSTIYYGEYDLKNQQKVKAKIEYEIKTIPETFKKDIYIQDMSSNIEMSLETGTIQVKDSGMAFITFAHRHDQIDATTLQFEIVDEGVNVYTYDDLLMCTNASKDGEIVVLRKSFESLDNVALMDENNVTLFGNYNEITKKFNFANEVYRFETTYNKEYIEQWNDFASKKSEYNEITSQVIAGLHIQKDFYGNGYTLNFHNLTYPYQVLKVTGDDGKVYDVPQLTSDNLFRGPLSFYTLGDPNGLPLITAFGQDNSGMYVEGNHILINDINVKNCDFGNTLSNLTYVGTVMDLNGSNITIQNSRLANGKNVLRSFSSYNVTIDNCMLSSSRNFLITTGANEYEKIIGNQPVEFTLSDGSKLTSTANDYLKPNAEGDKIVTTYISGNYSDPEKMKESILSMDKALNDESKVKDIYKGSMRINNCLFYQSGISAIALESYFNGPYLFAKSPSLIGSLFSSVSYEDRPLVPLEPENVSGISYPVKVNISGNTRFYDYKKLDTLDISGLISENISAIANSIFDQGIRKITIDDIFPIKDMLIQQAQSNDCIYHYTNEEGSASYFNIPIAYYGGGLNLSEVTYEQYDHSECLSQNIPIDLLSNYIHLPSGEGTMQQMKYLMIKTVTTVTGYQPFQFVYTSNKSPLLEETFNKAPSVDILISQAKGE